MLQHADGTTTEARPCHSPRDGSDWAYRMELSAALLDEQGCLIDRVIGFAFDTLGAIHLDIRVHPAECWPHTTRRGGEA